MEQILEGVLGDGLEGEELRKEEEELRGITRNYVEEPTHLKFIPS